MATVRERVLGLLEQHGGQFRAPEGNAGALIAQELGVDYNLASTALYRMVQKGELIKESDHPRRAYAYKLAPSPHGHGLIAAAEAAAPHILPRRDVAAEGDDLSTLLLQAVTQYQHRAAGFREAIAEARQALRDADARLEALEQELTTLGGQEPPG